MASDELSPSEGAREFSTSRLCSILLRFFNILESSLVKLPSVGESLGRLSTTLGRTSSNMSLTSLFSGYFSLSFSMSVRALVRSLPDSWCMAVITRLSNADSSRLPGVVDGVLTPFSVGVLLSPSPDCLSGLRPLRAKVAPLVASPPPPPLRNVSPRDSELPVAVAALRPLCGRSGATGVKARSRWPPKDAERPNWTGDPMRASSSPSEI